MEREKKGGRSSRQLLQQRNFFVCAPLENVHCEKKKLGFHVFFGPKKYLRIIDICGCYVGNGDHRRGRQSIVFFDAGRSSTPTIGREAEKNGKREY